MVPSVAGNPRANMLPETVVTSDPVTIDDLEEICILLCGTYCLYKGNMLIITGNQFNDIKSR